MWCYENKKTDFPDTYGNTTHDLFCIFHVIMEPEHLEKKKKVEKKSPIVSLPQKTTTANISVYFPVFSLYACVRVHA